MKSNISKKNKRETDKEREQEKIKAMRLVIKINKLHQCINIMIIYFFIFKFVNYNYFLMI